MAGQPLSLYIHIPFCTLRCAYCDFNSYTKLDELIPPFTAALETELRLFSVAAEGRPIPTVFFGGGTPSLLPTAHVSRIMNAVRRHYDLEAGAEVSLEANPGTVGEGYFADLLDIGINRLSLGVQSFHDDELTTIDRIHSADEATSCYEDARRAGFTRINLDLIYGLADQTMDRWRASLERAVSLAPEHLSLYALTVEEGTKLAYDIDHGNTPGPDPDMQADMYEWSQKRLAGTAYAQYEISNWSLPGEECRHNLVYWRNEEWLGLGPGAHSHWGGHRFADVYSPRRYIDLVSETEGGGPPSSSEPAPLLGAMRQVTFIDPQPRELRMADTAILALRLNSGLNLADFLARFGTSLEEMHGDALTELMGAGLLERSNGNLRLTMRGRSLANEVFVRLLPD